MGHFCELINNNRDGIIGLAFLIDKPIIKFIEKIVPRIGWYWHGLQVIMGFVSDYFSCQKDVAAFDISFDALFQAWPIVFLSN